MIRLQVNGQSVTVPIDDPSVPLLYALRNDLDLHGPKFGCGLGQCGACTVHINGQAVRSCVLPIGGIAETDEITTLEGLGRGGLHPLQAAFIEEQAVQRGYCINGMIMQAADLLEKNPHPSEAEIRAALANNLCRCGTHLRIIKAIGKAATA